MAVVGFNVFVFMFLNPLGLYQFGKRYVGKLYHDPVADVYTAETLSPFVFQRTRCVRGCTLYLS